MNRGPTPPYIDPQSGVRTRYHTWTPDVLGNWVGHPTDPNLPGFERAIDEDGDGEIDTWTRIWHDTDPANQIQHVETHRKNDDPTLKPAVYDRAGNLVWDSVYLYLYDGFNRLIQINDGQYLSTGHFDADSRPASTAPVGATLAAFTYDGLGRLIRSWRQNAALGTSEDVRWYYDGVRRIQEVATTTIGGSPTTVTREYVWGPGYADEIVCQIDWGSGTSPSVYYYLQDANYNVVAVVSPGSVGVPPAVLWQYAYDPYGRVLVAELQASLPVPVNRVGFQGLFLEPTGFSADNPGLSMSATILWCARNRFLSPTIGRFLTRDPAEAAIPILTALAFNGDTLDAFITGFSPTGHYADGFNLYQFVGSNPVNANDPLGLDGPYSFMEITSPDFDLDESISALLGQRVYVLGALSEGVRAIDLGVRMMARVAMSLLGIDSAKAVLTGRGGFWDYMDAALTLCPGGSAGKAARVVSKARGLKALAKTGQYIGKMVGHHTVPTAVLKALRPEVARAGRVHGMKGCKNIWQIPEELHNFLHGGGPKGGRWNADWWAELKKLGGPDKAEVEDVVRVREELIAKYGLEEYRP